MEFSKIDTVTMYDLATRRVYRKFSLLKRRLVFSTEQKASIKRRKWGLGTSKHTEMSLLLSNMPFTIIDIN